MTCKECHSDRQSVLNGKIAIHFCRLEGLDKPIVRVFQEILVCLNCGCSEFTVPEKELQVLSQDFPVKGVAASVQRATPASGEMSIKARSTRVN